MTRKVLAVVIGLFAGGAFNMAMVIASHAMYPLPAGVDPNDFEALKAHVTAQGMPTGAWIMVLMAHAGGSFVSGFICGVIAGRVWCAAAIGMGMLWMCGGIYMLQALPAPAWFAVADVVLYIPAALAGVALGSAMKRKSSRAVPAE